MSKASRVGSVNCNEVDVAGDKNRRKAEKETGKQKAVGEKLKAENRKQKTESKNKFQLSAFRISAFGLRTWRAVF